MAVLPSLDPLLRRPASVVDTRTTARFVLVKVVAMVRQRKLPSVSGARTREVPLHQGVKAETFVQLTREQQPGIGGDGGAAELDSKSRVEREPNRARFRVTHWMMPSAPTRHPRNPHFLRV